MTSPTVLVLCTGDLARSPLTAALLAAQVAELDGSVTVTSAGFGVQGLPVPAPGPVVARDLGLDLSSHRSVRVTGAHLAAADLVLTLTREHAREATALCPDAYPRTFTLAQLRRWLAGRTVPSDVGLGAWLDTATSGRSRTALLGTDPADVPDPIGRGRRAWLRTARRIDRDLAEIVPRLAPMWQTDLVTVAQPTPCSVTKLRIRSDSSGRHTITSGKYTSGRL